MQWMIAILTAVLQVLVPWAAKRSQPTAEDAAPQDELRKRLRDKIRKTWKVPLLLLAAMLLVSGCGARTVYVPGGDPVRLRETVRGVKVWVMGADGQPVAGKMDIPEGWYALPVPGNPN